MFGMGYSMCVIVCMSRCGLQYGLYYMCVTVCYRMHVTVCYSMCVRVYVIQHGTVGLKGGLPPL